MPEHVAIAEANLHEPKGVSTATVDQVYHANGAGSGTWKAAADTPDNVVVINSESNFPAPSGGTIQLEDDKNYKIGKSFSTSNRFIAGANNSITSDNINGPTITYTGTGDMFTGVDVNFDMHDITLVAATANQVFNFSEVGGGNLKVVTMRTVGITTCPKFGTFDNMRSLDVSDTNSADADDGVTIVGAGWLVLSLTKFALISTSPTFIGLDMGSSVHQNIEGANLFFIAPSGGIGIKGLAGSANLLVDNIADITNSTFGGGMTALDTITIEDKRWEFQSNSGLSNSTKAVDAYLSTLQLVTIATQSVFQVIGGTNFLSDVSSRFTITTAGVATYISEIDSCFIVTITGTLDKVAGGADVLAMRVAKGGTSIAKSQAQTQSADPTSVVSHAIVTLTNGDTIEPMIANNTTAGNVDVVDMNMSITLSG